VVESKETEILYTAVIYVINSILKVTSNTGWTLVIRGLLDKKLISEAAADAA
jgi:hypothetical protein